MKRIITALTVLLLLSGCLASQLENTLDNYNKPGGQSDTLSGNYTIDEFLELIAPAQQARDDFSEYATTTKEDFDNVARVYADALEKIGFKAGDVITISGKFHGMFSLKEYDMASITLTDSTHEKKFPIDGVYSKTGWATLLKKYENIKVTFTVGNKINDDGTESLTFEDAEVIAPSKIEYASNCSVSEGKSEIAFGEVVDIYHITYTEEELDKLIEDVKDNPNQNNLYHWYLAEKNCDCFVMIRDEAKNEIGVFIQTIFDGTPKIGDKIGCRGEVYQRGEGNVKEKFMDSTSLVGGFYIYEDE